MTYKEDIMMIFIKLGISLSYKEEMDFKNICLYETSLKQRKKNYYKRDWQEGKKGVIPGLIRGHLQVRNES